MVLSPGTVNIHGGMEEQGSKSEAQSSRDLTGNKVGLCMGISLWPTSLIVLRNLGGPPPLEEEEAWWLLFSPKCVGAIACPLRACWKTLLGKLCGARSLGQGLLPLV